MKSIHPEEDIGFNLAMIYLVFIVGVFIDANITHAGGSFTGWLLFMQALPVMMILRGAPFILSGTIAVALNCAIVYFVGSKIAHLVRRMSEKDGA